MNEQPLSGLNREGAKTIDAARRDQEKLVPGNVKALLPVSWIFFV
jgi:hypothetical protein